MLDLQRLRALHAVSVHGTVGAAAVALGYTSSAVSQQIAKLEREKAQLRHRSALLDPRKADPDMADELVRKDLGLVRPDEVIVPLD